MNRSLVGLLVGLTGCFPLIPGPWSQYDTPNDTRIVGEMWWTEYVGGYWGDSPADTGGAYWALFDAPQPGRSANELIFSGELGCRNGFADVTWFVDAKSDVSEDESTLSGENDFTLPWDSSLQLFLNRELDEQPAGAYALSGFDAGEGTFSVPSFVEVPEPLFYDASLLDGEAIQTRVARELSFTWETRESETDFSVVSAVLIDDADTEVERVICVLPTSEGHVDIDKDLWTDLASGSYWIISLGVAHETIGRVEGAPPGTGSRMLFTASTVGAISRKN